MVSHGNRKKRKKEKAHFVVDDSMIHPAALIDAIHDARTGSQVRLLFAIEHVNPPPSNSVYTNAS